MKSIYISLYLFLTFIGISSGISAQGTLASVVPTSAAQGSTIDMVIRGIGTHFNNQSTISIGGTVIIPASLQVPDQETMRLRIDLSTLPPGDYPLVITTNGSSTASFNFRIFEPGKALNISLMLLSVQTISVNDFDPNNLTNSPILFNVIVFNDNNQRNNLKAVMTLTGEKYGYIGNAIKMGITLSPNSQFSFNNKEFNSFNINSSNTDFFEKAIKTGTMPADEYTYQLEIFDESNVKLGYASGKNIIQNQFTKPELITPGTDFSNLAPSIRIKQPLFQWFSQGNNFEFAIYPVLSGQKTGEEVVLNRPVYKQDHISTTSFQYPSNAEMLEEGKTYAWQIKLNNTTSGGINQIASEVFWFTFSSSTPVIQPVADLKLNPEDCYIQLGQNRQFTVTAFAADNTPIDKPVVEWKVVPSDIGSIDKNGLFTATKTGSCAVIAKCGEVQEYATVNVTNFDASGWDMKLMMQKLFGLPATK